MSQRTLLRTGAVAAVVGAIAFIVLFLVIPVEDQDYLESPREAFREIATNAF